MEEGNLSILLLLLACACFAGCAFACKAGNCGHRRKLACYAGILLQALGLYNLGAINSGELHVGVSIGYYSTMAILVLAMLDRNSEFPFSWRLLGLFAACGSALAILPLRGHEIDAQVPGFNYHFVLATFAYGLFFASLVQMVEVYLINVNVAKIGKDKPQYQSRLPLLAMEKLVFRNIGIGFGVLTLTIASGMALSLLAGKSLAGGFSHKTLFAWLTWLVCAALLLARWRMGLRGLVALRWYAAAVVFLLLSYLGTAIVLDLVLKK